MKASTLLAQSWKGATMLTSTHEKAPAQWLGLLRAAYQSKR